MTRAVRSDCWPTLAHVLLIEAALGVGDRAKQALVEWRSRVDLDTLDRASVRLLPLLQPRVADNGPADPLVMRVHTAAAATATRNRAHVETACHAIAILRAAGIDSVLLKGLALIARGYMAPESRPMADADLLVLETRVFDARDALIRHGWRMEGRLDPAFLSVRHATTVRSPSGSPLDLHWHVFAECCDTGADLDLWEAAATATLDGVQTRTLCPADLLLHICVHGLQWSIVPPVRWVTDALLVLHGGAAIDWQRFVDQARRRVLTLPAIGTIAYLRDTFAAPIPQWVLQTLAEVPVPGWAKGEYQIKQRRRSPPRQVLFHWFQHRRLRASGTLLGDLVSVPFYARRRWQVRSVPASK